MHKDESTELSASISAAFQRYFQGGETFEIDLANMEIRIFHLEGSKWNGAVDRTVAKFLLELDEKLTEELEKRGVDLPRSEHGILALRIKKGSTDAYLEYVPQILEQLRLLTTGDKIMIMTGLLLTLGIWTGKGLMEKRAEIRMKELSNEAENAQREERLAILDRTLSLAEAAAPLQAPMKRLISRMDEADVIQLPGMDRPVHQKTAQEHLEKPTRMATKASTYYVDLPYIVEDLTTKTAGKWTIGLRFGNFKFTAKVDLLHEQIASLLEEFKTAHAKGLNIAPHLQVTAEFNAKGLKPGSARVIGIGGPRPGSIKISEAVERAKVKKSA